MPKPKILIVDDERNIVTALAYTLDKEGFRVVTAADGARGLELARRELPDLVLLDWMLPEMDGLEVCRALKGDRATAHIPIVLLTVKSSETDKVLGLELGADDYVTKPFSPRELIARVRALLRRSQPAPSAEVFALGDLRVDWGKHVVAVKQRPVELTPKEFELLRALVEAKGRVLSRDALLDKVWGYERSMEIQTRTVDLHISQLRRKVKPLAARILTVKGTGYRLVLDE
jgi:two-component system alkaline phosphatase synthesis response regulator PhoP